MSEVIKLLRPEEWAAFQAEGRFEGSEDDVRDGFIHLSAPDQVAGTAAKYFAGIAGVVAVSLDAGALGEALRWEASRGGQLFPHLYRPLLAADVVAVADYS
jgi:uncharacterized protein (DUF952 family)